MGTNIGQMISVGDRLKLSGGYDMEPAWLATNAFCVGTITAFIPGQNDAAVAVVHLDQPISVEGVTGQIVVLELRYVGAQWIERGTVHVELCDFEPESLAWQDRRHGKWVESNATYQELSVAQD